MSVGGALRCGRRHRVEPSSPRCPFYIAVLAPVSLTEIDNSEIDYFPYKIDSGQIKAIYKEFPGWEEDLSKMTNASEFPKNFNNYINYLEKELETPIKIVSVGPNRNQTIFR